MRQDWVDEPFLAIDVETTGVDVFNDRIVELAAVEIYPDLTTGDSYTTVIDPGIDIPDEAAAIHGITTARAQAEGAKPAEALEHVADLIFAHGSRRALLGFNMAFDWTLLNTEAQRHHVEWPCLTPILDPFLLDKLYDRYRKGSRKLVDVAAHYGVTLDADQAHGALADATAAGRVMRRMLERFPHLGEAHLAWLFCEQVRGSEELRISFIKYKRRTEPGFNKPAGWPLIAAPEPPRSAAAPAAGTGTDTQGVLTPEPAPGAGDDDGQAHGAPGHVVPDTAGEETTAGSSPAPGERGVTKRDVAIIAGRAFAAAGQAAPPRQKTKTIDRLRYALTHAITNGRAHHLDDVTNEEMALVVRWCVDIERGDVTYELDNLGVTFTLVATGEPRCVLWSDLEQGAA